MAAGNVNLSHISLWDNSAQETAAFDAIDGDLDTDVAIVGGGFTGLSTALHAAQRGVECQLLEATQIGFGGSGRNAGLLNAGLWLPPQDIRSTLGEKRGSELVRILSDAPDYVRSLIEAHQIRCELTRSGTIHAAHAWSGLQELERRANEWRRLGAPVDLLDRDETARLVGSEAFFGGLLDHRASTINPMGYVRGLARAAKAAGANIAVGVTVESLRREKTKWQLRTNRGTVNANSVILATNAYTDALWPGLRKTFTKIHYFQLATRPLGDRANSILPEGQGLWDTGKIMFSLRRDAYGRVIIGSMGTVIEGLSERWARRSLQRLFPKLGAVEFETSWHGQIAMTPDHLPRIYRLDDRLYTPIGYNGRGIGPGTMFGKAMAELVSGAQEDELPIPVSAPRAAPNAFLTSRFLAATFAANQLIKSV